MTTFAALLFGALLSLIYNLLATFVLMLILHVAHHDITSWIPALGFWQCFLAIVLVRILRSLVSWEVAA